MCSSKLTAAGRREHPTDYRQRLHGSVSQSRDLRQNLKRIYSKNSLLVTKSFDRVSKVREAQHKENTLVTNLGYGGDGRMTGEEEQER
jgi:hypothetical protein